MPTTPSLQINANVNQGVYSPNIMGNMFEWASDYMNGAWAEKIANRNFEWDSMRFHASPLYDHFSGTVLDRSKWTPMTLDGSGTGTCSVSNSVLTISGVSNARYGVLSRNVPYSVHADVTIKATLSAYSGVNGMISLNGAFGSNLNNNIEFGIDNGHLAVYGDGITSYIGAAAQAPIELKIIVGHLKGSVRDISFYANDTLVHTVYNFNKLQQQYRIFLYSWSTGTSQWDSVSFFPNTLYEHFDAEPLNQLFVPALLAGDNNGAVQYNNSQAIITGGSNSRYGLLSKPIHNSAVNWTYIEAKLDSVSGTNALFNIFGGNSATFEKFIEFGVEGGYLKVYTASGAGNWSGSSVAFPCTLRIELSPYYANGRNIRFFYNDQIVYALWENKELPKHDYKVFLYGWSNSVTAWDWITVRQEHFGDPYGPNFEGASLPNDWKLASLNGGALGSVNSHDGECTITGVANSRFGIGGAPVENSDIKPFRVVAKLISYSGVNGLLHVTTQEPDTGFDHYVEFGVENGRLAVFTPTGSWQGSSVTLPVYLTIDISAYGTAGRTITFICNGEPVYTLENSTALTNDEFRIFLYGYGESITTWDYGFLYTTETWKEDGYDSWGSYLQDDSQSSVSGMYTQKITVSESASGCLGISQSGISVKAGNAYQVSLWAKCTAGISGIRIIVCEDAPLNSGYAVYAQQDISNISISQMQKYTITLTPSATNTNCKIFIGAIGIGDLWIDQASMMPTSSSEVLYGGWRKDFIDNLVELNPPALRWPGGIIADWYNWSDGIGDRDMRPPLYFAQFDPIWMNNDVGIDEFLQLCEALNISSVLNVNYGSSTASYAADFVEYVNGSVTTTQGALRAANGHSSPYAIRHWEIGNETWGGWVPGHTTANQFASDYALFYAAMTAKDPTIRCIGEGGDGNSWDQTWNQTMINANAGILDELSIHYYSPQKLPIIHSNDDVFLATVAAPLSVKSRINASRDIISACNHDIKIAVTEYNAMYFSTLRHQTLTMQATLQVAGLLNVFMDYPGLTDHNDYSCLAQFWDGSTMRFGQRGLFQTPSYMVLWLYTNHRGEMKVQSILDSPTFSNPEIGNVPAMSDNPWLEALVTRNLAGNKLYIAILNRNNTQDYNLPVSISGLMSVSASGTMWTVSANHYMDANTWKNTGKIAITQTSLTNTGLSFTITIPKLSVSVIELDITGLSSITQPVICGVVRDSAGNAISNASIQVNGVGSTVTDTNGYYQISATEGKYSLNISHPNYNSETMYDIYVYPTSGVTVQPIILSN